MSDIEHTHAEPQSEPQREPEQRGQRRMRRASRYQRVQQRKAQQSASDQKFYNAMFSLMGVLALFSILLGAIMINDAQVDVSSLQPWAEPWIFGFSKLEVGGFVFVGLIAIAVGLRMKSKR